jgi:hypothetical protein
MNSGDILHCSLCRTVESSPNKGEGEGEEQRDGNGLRYSGNAGGRSLSTINMQHEQWRVNYNSLSTVHFAEQWRAAQTKEKGKGKRSAAVMD